MRLRPVVIGVRSASTAVVLAIALVAAVPATAQEGSPDTGAVDQILEGEETGTVGAYVYDPGGRRDPFRSLLVGRESTGLAEGLGGLLIEELNLQGIWRTRAGFVAQMQGPNNVSWLVRKSDQLMDGEVLDVTKNEIVFRQQVNDPTRLKPFREIVKELVPTKK